MSRQVVVSSFAMLVSLGFVAPCPGAPPMEAQLRAPATVAADACPPGFSGPGCVFCTWLSDGADCQAGSPRDLLDLDAIKAMTLEDLAWTPKGTVSENGVTLIWGDWSAGVFPFYTPEGEPVDVTLREAAAVYIPEGYPDTANPTLGLVYAAHYPTNIFNPIAGSIARNFGVPVLYHGEYPNCREAGYPERNTINLATGAHLMRANPCFPEDFVRGNFPLALARTDTMAITLLQRLAEDSGGDVSKVALRGFSKEGVAAWLAFIIDDRIEVGIPGGAQTEDPLSSAPFKVAAYGCAPGAFQEEAIHSTADGLEWKLNTPAGAASTNLFSTAHHKDLLYPRFLLIDGDVCMYDMHDGKNGMVTGGETDFLDGFVERPWRYIRKPTTETGADGDDGDVISTTAVPVLGVELLVAGPGSEAVIYPNITGTSATLAGESFVVTATASTNAEFARVWWTWSDDMVFTEETQQPWTNVSMTHTGAATWTSPAIDVPPGKVIAWYAEVGNTATVAGVSRTRTHAAPIYFLRPDAAKTCEAVATYCTDEPRARRHRRGGS